MTGIETRIKERQKKKGEEGVEWSGGENGERNISIHLHEKFYGCIIYRTAGENSFQYQLGCVLPDLYNIDLTFILIWPQLGELEDPNVTSEPCSDALSSWQCNVAHFNVRTSGSKGVSESLVVSDIDVKKRLYVFHFGFLFFERLLFSNLQVC